MSDQANDFMKDYQAMAQESWERFMGSAQALASSFSQNPYSEVPPGVSTGQDTVERAMAGLRSYMTWMQGAATAGNADHGGSQGEGNQLWEQWLAGAGKPLAQGFGGMDGVGGEGFIQQLQSWANAGQKGTFDPLAGQQGATPSFGFNREQQARQRLLVDALKAAWEASSRYQVLVERASKQGMERFQAKLAEHADQKNEIKSLKVLYDLWVDASEEAYAEMANSDEFREAYGEMVNTQMAARELQQKQVEQACQQLDIPTRAEVSNLGERLQQVRRESRAMAVKLEEQAAEMARSKRELDTLRKKSAASEKQTEPKKARVAAPRKAPAVKSTVAGTPAMPAKAPIKVIAKAPTKASKSSAAVTEKSPTKKPAAKKSAAARKRVATTRATNAPSTGVSTRKR